jgi:hypothetical protein
VTFVRVSGGDVEGTPDTSEALNDHDEADLPTDDSKSNPNPILMLDQDQINRLENVLRSEEAKDFLGEVLKASPGNNPNESLGDLLSSSLDSIGPPPPLISNTSVKQAKIMDDKKAKVGTAKVCPELIFFIPVNIM